MEGLAGRVILLWGWPRRLAAFFAGLVATLALSPFDFPAACFLAFPILVWLIDGTPADGGLLRRLLPVFSVGWWFGFGYFLAGLWWVGAAFFGEDGEPAWMLGTVAVLALSAALALFYGFATLVARLLWSEGLGRIAALAFGFGLAEWLRSVLLSGFAWNAVGYAAMPIPVLMQGAQVLGIVGMSALAVFVFSAPALLGTRLHARAGLALAALMVVGQIGYGYYRFASSPEAERLLEVRIVQPATNRRMPFDEAFTSLLELTERVASEDTPAPRLILWPERSVPFVLSERPELLDAMSSALEEGQALVAGTVRAEGSAGARRLYNSAVLVEAETGIAGAADQQRFLLPGSMPLLRKALPAVGLSALLPGADYAAGSGRQPLVLPDGTKALPLIGTEAVIPGAAARYASDANLILSLADYAAFSGTPGPHQYLRQAQLRAVEAGLPLMVAMPGGLSAAIDSHGRIVDALAVGASGTVDARLPFKWIKIFNPGNIALRGLTFSAIFAMFALLVIIRVGIAERRN